MKMLQGVTIKKWEPLEVQTVTPPHVGVPVQVKVPETEVLRTVQAAHRDTLVVVHRHVEGTVTPVHGAVAGEVDDEVIVLAGGQSGEAHVHRSLAGLVDPGIPPSHGPGVVALVGIRPRRNDLPGHGAAEHTLDASVALVGREEVVVHLHGEVGPIHLDVLARLEVAATCREGDVDVAVGNLTVL